MDSAIPLMPWMGVRSSWEVLAKLVFELVRLLQAEVLLVGQLDLLLQLLGLAFDELDLVLHRALHVAKRLGQPVDVIVGAFDGDGDPGRRPPPVRRRR
jgi:hypothetical protein